jgi:hypothetical protein
MSTTSLTTAVVSLFLIGQLWQLAAAQTGTKASVSAAFSKAAVKALLTIDRNSDKQAVDAVMVDLAATASTRAERSVGDEIALFEAIHSRNEWARQSDLEAAKAMVDAGMTNPGISEAVEARISENHSCVVAWLPKLRALSAVIPKQCKSE